MALRICETDREKALKMFRELFMSRTAQATIWNNGGRIVRDLGEEAISIGSLFGLEDTDIISCYFRGDAANLRIRGAYSPEDIMAGWFYRKGISNPITYGYPNSWTDVEHGVIGTTSSLIGADAVICAGAALAQKMQKTGRVVLFLAGDGATSKGDFYETMNLAKLKKLPLIILIRNNNYAMSTTMDRNIAVDSFADLPKTFNIPVKVIDGNDMLEVAQAVSEAAEYARSGNGPSAIVAKTFRMGPHTIDDEDEYRRDVDRSYWIKHDPVLIMENHLKDRWQVSSEEILKIKEECEKEAQAAYEWAAGRPPIEIDEVVNEQQKAVDMMWREER